MATTYYVDGDVGNDSNAGTSEGSGNAWATIDKAMNEVVDDQDHVYVKASVTYYETFTIDTAGSVTDSIVFEGYTTTPGDGGKVTIDGEATRASGLTSSLAGGTDTHYVFKNFIFYDHTGTGVDLDCDAINFRYCEFNENGGDGVDVPNGCTFWKCTAEGNGVHGFRVTAGNHFHFCQSTDNVNTGFYSSYGNLFYRCISDLNGNIGFWASHHAAYGSTSIINCTVDGDNKATNVGIGFARGPGTAINNIVYDCQTAFMINQEEAENIVHSNNLVYDCSTDYTTYYANSVDTVLDDNDVTSDPSFTDDANGDYTLTSDSPARGAGVDITGFTDTTADIGAIQSEAAECSVIITG